MPHSSANLSPVEPAIPVEIAAIPDSAIVRQRPGFAIAAFVILAAIFVAVFQFPPILDYPNHYARMWLLAGGIAEPPFNRIYALDWNQTFTNVGIDLAAYWLGPVIGVPLLACGLLFLAIVLPPLGAIALHRRLFGGSYYWQIAILYFAWCATLIGGFINFQIGLGMALFFATVDHGLQPKSRTVLFAWRAVAGLLLTVMHIFSLGFYMALVCGLEFSPTTAALKSPRDFVRLCARLVVAMLACTLPAICLFLYAPVLPDSNNIGLGTAWNDTPGLILANLISAIWTYTALADTLLLIPLVLVCTNAVRTGRLRLHAGLAVTAIGLLVLACISPRHVLGTGWISWRFPIMAALVAMAMVCPLPRLPRRQAFMLAVVLACVALGRTGWIGLNWWYGQADVANIRTVLADVSEGSAILPMTHKPKGMPIGIDQRHYAWNEDTFRHLPTLAVPYARAFVPTIFTAAGKQPLTVLPQWKDIAVPEGNLFSIGLLNCPAELKAFSAIAPYLANWRQRFDFVLVVNADMPDQYSGDTIPSGLRLAADTPFAKLYAIDKAFVPQANVPAATSCPNPLTTEG